MFADRQEAGKLLSKVLTEYRNNHETAVLAIPKGGVVVGNKLAQSLNLPLIPLTVIKLKSSQNPELSIGALAPEGIRYFDCDLILKSGISQTYVDMEVARRSEELDNRLTKFNQISRYTELYSSFSNFIMVDDGVATGSTVLAGLKYIRSRMMEPEGKIILASPVIAKETYFRLKSNFHRIVALEISDDFTAVAQFYREFNQVSEEEIINILHNRHKKHEPEAFV